MPSTPMKDEMLATAGSSSSASASSRWRSPIAPKEIDCGASVMPCSAPVSCIGKKPFGMKT